MSSITHLMTLVYMLLSGLVGYYFGRRDWKRIADEACEVAGKSLLLVEAYREKYEEYDEDEG